jgi:branched-chain amino acid transport system permease protein
LDVSNEANVVLSGLTQGALYSTVAISFNVTYATTGVLNLAQGEFFMLGSVLGAYISDTFGWPLIPTMLATLVIAGVLGGLEELLAVRPAARRGRGARGWLLSTLGFSILIRSIVSLTIGQDLQPFPDIFSRAPTTVAGVRIVPQQVFVIAVAIAIALGLVALYERTLVGRSLEAVRQDREAAAFRGVPIGLLSTSSFALGGVISALGGFVGAPLTGAAPSIGFPFALKGFIAATIGGMGSVKGALVGGLSLGVVEALASQYVGASYRNAAVFVVLLVVLVGRPQGILGNASVREV